MSLYSATDGSQGGGFNTSHCPSPYDHGAGDVRVKTDVTDVTLF